MRITLRFEQKRVVPKPVNNSSLLPSLKTRAYRNPFSISFSWFRVFSFQFDIPFILSKVQKTSNKFDYRAFSGSFKMTQNPKPAPHQYHSCEKFRKTCPIRQRFCVWYPLLLGIPCLKKRTQGQMRAFLRYSANGE